MYYDPRGNVATQTLEDGTVITHTYDAANRRTRSDLSTGGVQAFAYDDGGRLSRATQTMDGHTTATGYGYNAVGDVITTTQQLDGGSAWPVQYAYNYVLGEQTVTYPSGAVRVYKMDALNRLDAVEAGGGAVIADYAYDVVERLTDHVRSDGRAYTYTWSARGQMLAEYTQGYPVREFTYDTAGRMVEATVFTLTTRFRYNGLGARVSVEVVGEGTTTYTLDYAAGSQILAETSGDSTVYYPYGHTCLGEYRDGAWLYYLNDASGYLRQGTDAQGTVTSGWLFDPDGTVLAGPEGPVSRLICGGVYDWSTGLLYKGGRYFDPTLGIWLALAPLIVLQSWRGKKGKRRRGFPWYLVLVLCLVGVSGTLTACNSGGTSLPPTLTACIGLEITTPFGPPLGNNVVFVDPPSGGQHPTHPQAQTWSSSDKQTVEPVLTDVINNKFGGPTGFGGLNTVLTEFGVSANNPIRLFRKPIGSNPNVAASVSRPNVTIFDHWFSGGSSLQEALLGHEMTHYWDQAYGYALTTEMGGWINWGTTATDRGSHAPVEDIAEAVRVYFWNQYDEGRKWTDDIEAGLALANDARYGGRGRDGLRLDPGQLQLPTDQRQPSATGTIQVQDRYDWLEMKFTGRWR